MIVDRPYPTTVAVVVPRTCTRPSLMCHRFELPGLQPSRAAKELHGFREPIARESLCGPTDFVYLLGLDVAADNLVHLLEVGQSRALDPSFSG